jgi:hypothetical protein
MASASRALSAALVVVIISPGCQFDTGLTQAAEQDVVQLLISELAVEAFDEPVLHPRAASDCLQSLKAGLARRK